MAGSYEYLPQDTQGIMTRKCACDFPDDLDPVRIPDDPLRSHLFNGLPLTMPYREPYLGKSSQAATGSLEHAEIRADMRDCNGQEARHYQCHRRLNELLKANGYPELARVARGLAKSFARLARRGMRTQLGTTPVSHG